jgi:plastocyanin
MKRLLALIATTALTAAGCAGSPAPVAPAAGSSASPVAASPPAPAKPARPVDPRTNGLEIGLAEWAVTLEAGAIRPGRVTFVIRNGGTRGHGFEIEAEGRDSSGHGSGDGFKVEDRLLQPGQTSRVVLDLAPGLYKVECLVDGHDDLGMEALLDVRPDAPLVRPVRRAPDAVAIEGIAFRPGELTVPAGTEVTWTNRDPTAHTVSAEDDSFDSRVLDPGATFSWTFETTGTVTYLCKIHPDMQGSIRVD